MPPQTVATIDEAQLNAVLARAGEVGDTVPLRWEEDAVVRGIAERRLPSGLTVHYKAHRPSRIAVWSVDLRWRAEGLRADIRGGVVRLLGTLRVEAGDFRDCRAIQGRFGVRLIDGVVHIRLEPMPIALHAHVMGRHLRLKTFDLAARLPEFARHMRVELPIPNRIAVGSGTAQPIGVDRRLKLILEPDRIVVRG
jgi:hypothetical protein